MRRTAGRFRGEQRVRRVLAWNRNVRRSSRQSSSGDSDIPGPIQRCLRHLEEITVTFHMKSSKQPTRLAHRWLDVPVAHAKICALSNQHVTDTRIFTSKSYSPLREKERIVGRPIMRLERLELACSSAVRKRRDSEAMLDTQY